MTDLSAYFGSRLRSTTPTWSTLSIELRDADCGNIDVEWLPMEETIVLETEAEAELA